MPLTAQQVQQLYVAYYGRPADPVGLAYWQTKTLDEAIAAFGSSTEYTNQYAGMSTVQIVNQVYQNLLGRDADTAGLLYWSTQITSGALTLGNLVITMLQNALGKDVTTIQMRVQFAEAFTAALDTTAEIVGYSGQAAASAARAAMSSIVAASVGDTSTLTAALANLDAIVASVVEAGSVVPGQTFTLTTGVDNITGTSGNDTINAVQTPSTGSVFGGLDVIDGGDGNDTLNVQDTATASNVSFSFNGATIKNVEAIAITTSGSLGGSSALDISGFTGLNTFTGTANSASSGVGVNLKAASTTDVTVTAQSGSIEVQGGKNVTATGTAAVTLWGDLTNASVTSGTTSAAIKIGDNANSATKTAQKIVSATIKGGSSVLVADYDGASSAASKGTLTTVTISETAATAVDLYGKALTNLNVGKQETATTITVDNTGASADLDFNLSVANSGKSGQVVTVKNDMAKSVAITSGGTANFVKIDSDTSLKTVTVVGAGALNLDLDGSGNTALATFDGSAATGNLTLSNLAVATTTVKTGAGKDSFTLVATSKATVDTGAGDDTVTLNSTLAAGSTINLGAGNDKLLNGSSGSVAPSSGTNVTVIDGGDGIDLVAASLVNAGNGSVFKNFEVLGLDLTSGTLDASLLTGSTITQLELLAGGGTYTNITPAQSLKVATNLSSSATTTLTFNGVSGTSDEYTITFAGSANTAPSSANFNAQNIVAAGIETFNIVSGGTNAWNAITLKDNAAAQKVIITGAANLDLAFAGTFGSTTSPNTGVSLIDGSAATGKLNIITTNVTAATAGLTVKGGAGNDTITLAQKATVDAGAGDDTIIVSSAGGTITTGAGADVVNVKAAVAGSTTAPVITTITDFTVGTDKLTLKDDTGTEAFQDTKVDVNTATALFGGTVNALVLAAAANTGSVSTVVWFQYAGDTYVFYDRKDSSSNYGTFDANDIIVKITGLVDLSGLTVNDFDFA